MDGIKSLPRIAQKVRFSRINLRICENSCQSQSSVAPIDRPSTHFSQMSGRKILITSRETGYEKEGLSGQLPHYRILPLDKEPIEKHIRDWYQVIEEEFGGEKTSAKELDSFIEKVITTPNIFDLAKTPLLLTIIILIKLDNGVLPSQRARLYEEAAAH